jgi:hypothetical protein
MPFSSPQKNFENSFHPAEYLVGYVVNAQRNARHPNLNFCFKFREIPVISSRYVTQEHETDGQTGAIQGCERT